MSTVSDRSSDSAALKRRLQTELVRLRLRIVGNAILMLLAAGGLLGLVAVLSLDAWPLLGSFAPVLLWITLAAVVSWVGLMEVALPLWRVSNLKSFSFDLERHGRFDNLLVAATEFATGKQEDPVEAGTSDELVGEILRRARLRAESSALAPRIPLVGVVSHFALSLVVLFLWLLLAQLTPGRIDAAFFALTHPSSLNATPPDSGLYVLSGKLSVPVGEPVHLRARDLIGGDPAAILEISYTGDFWQPVPTRLVSYERSHAPYLEWEAVIARVEDPFRYRFRKGELLTRIYDLTVKERPVISTLQARILPPAYTQEPTGDWRDVPGTMEVLEGSRILLRGEASAPLRSAQRVSEAEDNVDLAVDGTAFADTLLVMENLDFSVALTDSDGVSSDAATMYHFVVIKDATPSARIISPQAEVELGRDLQVRVEGLAADDVGLHQVNLLYRTPDDEEWKRQLLVEDGVPRASSSSIEGLQVDAGQRELALAFTWKLGEVELFPGDALAYCLEAVDGNAIKGGQRGRSQVHTLRLPALSEVFEEQRQHSEQQRDELGGMLQQGEELQEHLDQLRRELMKNPKPDWAKQQEIKELLKNQEKLRQQAKESAERMQTTLDEFQRNNSGSMELLQKMETVQELLESLQDESLQSYLDAMDKAMDQLSSQDLRRAMDDAANNQQEMNRRLDRTISLLRQLERERAMSDLVEEAKEYLARQEELQKELPKKSEEQTGKESQEEDQKQSGEQSQEESQKSRNDESFEFQDENAQNQQPRSEEEIARMQKELTEQTRALEEQLEKRLEELKKQLESGEASDAAAQEMKKALEEAQKQMEREGSSSESMSDAKKKMSEGESEEARKSMAEAMKRLISLYQVLAKGQKGMTQASMQFAVEKLQQTAYDLLQISFEEEAVVGLLESGVKDQRLDPVTRRQFHLTRSAQGVSDDLHELAGKNFLIGEKLLQSLRNLVEAMQNAVQQMEYGRPKPARVEAETSMGMMNKIVIGLLTSAQQQCNGGGGGSASEQMQQMTDDQSRLNSMTEELRKKAEAGLSSQERQQLAQLKAMQQQIRQQLDELRNSLQDEKEVLGDLGQLEKDMERSEQFLQKGRLQSENRQLQNHILSRLLDAERSVRERDFARRRRSETGKRLFGAQEGTSGPEEENSQLEQLRRWRAPGKAPREYQDEVRRYFRRIQSELEKGKAP